MSMTRKILFTSHTANFAKFNQPLIQDLRQQGYRVDYASAGEEPVTGVDQNWVIPFARSPLALKANFRAYRELKQLIEHEQYDLIHCHTPMGGVVTRLAAKKARTDAPVVYTAHGLHFYKKAPLINWLLYYQVERWLARWTDTMILINREDYQRVQREFKVRRVEQINGVGVDLQRFRPVSAAQKQKLRHKHHLGADDFILVYVAELNKNKDQALLIDSLPKLTEEIPGLKLLLIGDGPLKEKLERKVWATGLAETVLFPGYQKDVAEWYQLADITVSASQREGLGLNVVEGIACGLPVVIRDNRGHREIMSAGAAGRIFKNAAEFQAAILELYHDAALRQKIGKRNRGVANYFSLEKARAKMAEIYADLLGTFTEKHRPDRAKKNPKI